MALVAISIMILTSIGQPSHDGRLEIWRHADARKMAADYGAAAAVKRRSMMKRRGSRGARFASANRLAAIPRNFFDEALPEDDVGEKHQAASGVLAAIIYKIQALFHQTTLRRRWPLLAAHRPARLAL